MFSPFAAWFSDGATISQRLPLIILHNAQNPSIIDFSYTFFTSRLKPNEPFFGPVTTVELNGKTGTGAPLSPVSSLHAGFSVKGEGFGIRRFW